MSFLLVESRRNLWWPIRGTEDNDLVDSELFSQGTAVPGKSPKLIPRFKGDMFFSPIDPVWVALAIVVLFFVKPGVKPLWRMVRACLEDKRCVEAVKAGQKILTEQQESMSEEDKERMSRKKKKG